MRRVAITGLGTVSPAGHSIAAAWDAVAAGRSAIGTLENVPLERLTVRVAAQVKGFDPSSYFSRKQASMMDRVSQFAVVAARQAVADAGFEAGCEALAGAMCILGVAVGGLNTLDDSFHALYAENRTRLHPLTIPRLMVSAPASQISMDLGIRGMSFAVASACASGTHAIGQALRAIRAGEAELVVTGGAESCVTVGTLMGWEALRVLSFETCRPFSKNRDGLVLGEGAAVLVLEEWEHALARGARIYAEVSGFGANADAGDLTSPDGESVAAAMRLAMADAGVTAREVGYINAHGTGTMMNDLVESAAIRAVFGDSAPPVSSTKGVMGHSLGAAGAIEAMVTALALHHQLVPPTANCTEPDPAIGLDVVAEGARAVRFETALSNSFAFGGLNAVLALRRYPANG
jgi:nodulation protein E